MYRNPSRVLKPSIHILTFDSQKALNMRKQHTGETKAKHCVLHTHTLWVAKLIIPVPK